MSAPIGPATVVKLAPSDLTFLWDECQRCFWLKAKGVLKRPSAPFPKIFTRLDGQTKDYFFGRRAEDMAEGLRPGREAFGDRWVRSAPLHVPGHDTQVALAGRIDTALAFDDGSYGVIDFKTSQPKAEHVPFYGRQLHAYALALENPGIGALELSPVTQLGLLCVEPVAMIGLDGDVAYKGASHFLEIERDDDAFLAFLSQVLFVLERPDPPDATPGCSYCSYLAAGSLLLFTGMYQPWAMNSYTHPSPPPEPVSPTVMVEALLSHAASTGDLAPSTLVEFADVMRRFAMFMERGLEITDVSSIGETDVRAFIQSRQADGGKPSVSRMHNRRTVCRYLFRTAKSLDIRVSDPTAAMELPPRTPVRPRPLTDEEVELCRSHALFHPADLLHPVAWALGEATARTYEIARVLVGDVDLASGTARLGGSPRCHARTVAFTGWGLAQVRRRLTDLWAAPADPLLPLRSRKVPRASASMGVIEVLRAAGIKADDVRPSSVVAWRGARAYAQGAPIERVAALLGMTSLDRAAALIGAGPNSNLP